MPFKNGILNQLFGDKNFSDIDKRIDNLIDNLPPSSYNSNASPETNASDLISDLVTDEDSSSKESLSGGGGDELSSLFQNISIPRERQARYNLYDEIIKSVPLISRIVKVYAANVIQKNPTTGESLVFEKQENLGTDESQKGEEAQEFIEQFFKAFDVSRKLRNTIIPKQLKYGDCYVEIMSVNEEKMNLPSDSNILNEAKNLDSDLDAISQSSNSLSSFDSCISRFADLITDVRIVEDEDEDSSSTEASDHSTGNDNTKDTKETKGKKGETHDFNDVVFKIHSPHNIITLQTKHGTCLGYLEVMQETETTGFGFSQSLSGIVGKVNQLSNRQGQSDEKLTDRLVHHTLKKVIKKAKNGKTSSKIKNQDTEELLKTLDSSVYNIVKRMFIEQGFNNKKKFSSGFTPMRTRFIPTSRMVAFNNPNVSDYDPYSQSIIEDLILPGKLYMLNTLSNSIMKLSRSSLIRKWTLDIGPQRMASQNIQKLKREIHNSRITLDDLNSFKSIPKIMSDYKDMFVLSQQGQTPVDVD